MAAGEAANSGSRESLGNPRNKNGLEQGGGGAGRVEGEGMCGRENAWASCSYTAYLGVVGGHHIGRWDFRKKK